MYGKWQVKIKDLKTGSVFEEVTDYVFIGAGGAAIPLLHEYIVSNFFKYATSFKIFDFNLPFTI
jgi:L-2-hydroxyglutarate oxidase LhgO